jgi:hypothetical protein
MLSVALLQQDVIQAVGFEILFFQFVNISTQAVKQTADAFRAMVVVQLHRVQCRTPWQLTVQL